MGEFRLRKHFIYNVRAVGNTILSFKITFGYCHMKKPLFMKDFLSSYKILL